MKFTYPDLLCFSACLDHFFFVFSWHSEEACLYVIFVMDFKVLFIISPEMRMKKQIIISINVKMDLKNMTNGNKMWIWNEAEQWKIRSVKMSSLKAAYGIL